MRTITHVCSVIPEPMLRHAAEHGDAADREVIERTLAQTAQVREERLSEPPPARIPQSFSAYLGAQGSPGRQPRKHRYVYDAHHLNELPGFPLLNESSDLDAFIDPAAREAWIGLGAMFDFLATEYHRNSIDGYGLALHATVHYGTDFANAMWDGTQLVFGDGDGKLFVRFAFVDVIGHELMHGVIQYVCRLRYTGDAGALNEHFADVYGSLVKQYFNHQDVTKADWLVGKGVFGKDVQGEALRSMARPGTAYNDPILGRDPQPAHMRGYVHTKDDHGGVHINSGIPNHAFYLAATAMGGFAWEAAGRIWWGALERLTPDAVFQDLSDLTYAESAKLFGARSHEHRVVGNAWRAVGLPPSSLM